ncbi:DUF3597 domain-containing protein [Pseudomonas sp. 18058]|uniref:DUF3597 domain-containing protein n=1 Tax=Pseudomonas sp. 18058 TaxID=2681406 RepID=UPI001359EDCB|nr:DUF3597 domain-containing protein [Pseudomonas sp. 18058]
MSLFTTILEKLGIGKHATSSAQAAPAAPTTGTTGEITQNPPSTPTAAISEVDVASKLEALASQQTEQLNWRTSIVDLLKLLSIDSSLAARKELAAELHYTGSTDDSAAMNTWLHSVVMKKLAENGGKVPADLLD